MRQESEASLGRDVAKSFQNLCGEDSVGYEQHGPPQAGEGAGFPEQESSTNTHVSGNHVLCRGS